MLNKHLAETGARMTELVVYAIGIRNGKYV